MATDPFGSQQAFDRFLWLVTDVLYENGYYVKDGVLTTEHPFDNLAKELVRDN